uniref:Beta/gamma crystallin 'Greek key' domain-containing protein n=1 Tax=Leptobrachium leishanense TaxID=445787 RepID=A0A8C5LHG2_9ANUR
MSSLQLFAENDLKGESVTLRGDIPKLSGLGFRKKAMSLRVSGHPWVVFTEDNYVGDFRCYKGENLSIPGYEKKICSVRVIKRGLDKPQLVIYEDTYYGGQALTLSGPVESFESSGFQGKGLSEIAVKGAWIIYEENKFRGRSRIVIAGDQNYDYYERVISLGLVI